MNFRYNYDVIAVVSKSQSGKTQIIKKLINNVPKEDLLILDSNFEYNDYINIYQPIRKFTEELDKFILQARTQKNKLIILEDIDLYKPLYSKEFGDLIINGQHQNLGIIWASRRVLGLEKTLLQNSTYIIMSKDVPVEDKEYISNTFETGDARKGIEGFLIDWNMIQNLNEYEFAILDVKNHKLERFYV